VLQRGTGQVAGAPIACVGAGTGLGECYLTADMGGDYSCHASEGGHAEFSPRNLEQVHLQSHLKQKFQEAHRVSVERVVSGPGILSVYEYFAKTSARDVDQSFSKQLEMAGDLKPALIAQNKDCALCRRTMALFMSQYGSEAGVACCKWIPRGGLYLTGGITSKNMAQISDPDGLFMKSMVDKGRLSGLVQSIPVYAVLVEDLGERGAYWQAFRLYQRHMDRPSDTHEDTAATAATAAAQTTVLAASSDTDTFVLTLSIAAAAAVVGFALGRSVRP
jgi:glucokinase